MVKGSGARVARGDTMGIVNEDVIPVLRVRAADAAVKWYELLGFTAPCLDRSENHSPSVVEIARDGVRMFLSEREDDVQPGTLVYLRVHDVEAIAAEFGAVPEDFPWAREIELRDPDGNRIRIGTPTA